MKSKFSFFFIVFFLLAACATPQTQSVVETATDISEATKEPTATLILPTFTPTPNITNIIIDGNASDWEGYTPLANDISGDAPQGTPDITQVRIVINDQSVYVFIKLADSSLTGKINLGFDTDGKNPPDYFVTVWPREKRNVYTVGVSGGSKSNDAITTAQGEVIEAKFPLALMENKEIIKFNVQVELDGLVGDSIYEMRPRISYIELEPTPLPGAQPKAEKARVEFAAEDGHSLVGYYYPSWKTNAPVIVLVHQFGLPQENWSNYGMVDWLQNWPPDGEAKGIFPAMPVDQSFAVFTLDLRGFGESEPAIPNNLSDEEFNVWGANWVLDVKAAVNYVKSLPNIDASQIVLIGANNGADASVAACEDCLGVLALSAGSYVGLDTKTNAEKLDSEGKVIWCVSTENSQGTDVATCSSITGNQYQWINFPGDGRGMQLIRDDKAPDGIGQTILDFLAAVFNF